MELKWLQKLSRPKCPIKLVSFFAVSSPVFVNIKFINYRKVKTMKKILIAFSFLLFSTFANADCNIKSGSINILANDFPALRTLVETAKELSLIHI